MKKILIVEDNAMMRKLLSSCLVKENFDVVEAEDGLDGLKNVQQQVFDLIITDIIMPEMEGLEFIKIVKEDQADVKIIAISGGSPYYLVLAKKLGIDGVFTKPINQQVFITKIKELLNPRAFPEVA